jgi:hydroxylamine reductase
LDRAHTTTYGNPVPTKVRITPVAGKAILVSGHDLKDLEELLKQTEGTGIHVYTHGEMLPAHGYPELKKYSHLVGNYGGAWQDQREEFEAFPGPILMTTNCIQKPKDSYAARIFTAGMVGWPGVRHLTSRDYRPLIESAREAKGFERTELEKTITVGFGHQTVTSVAATVVSGVQSGAIKHFFVVGGCDGAKPGRNYFTDFVTESPKDTMVLTLGCGKYRFNKEELGEIGGIPRLLDLGQCNDAYSAIRIALELSKAFKVGVNELPLSLVVSWFEQKAVAVLLTLLHLGIRNIRLGPSLPAFVTPAALSVLVEKFGIKPVTTAQGDLSAILRPAA